MKLLILDNYDSFTFNLVQLIRETAPIEYTVVLNDKITIDAVEQYDKILLSPGPDLPSSAGIMPALIKKYAAKKSILGVCLGHQAIAENFGATIVPMHQIMHGEARPTIITANDYIFNNMSTPFNSGRYHSWVVSTKNFPDSLTVTAKDDKGYIMALRHNQYDVHGIQFHPESIMTPQGATIIKNWLLY